jgi:hypothetical protein
VTRPSKPRGTNRSKMALLLEAMAPGTRTSKQLTAVTGLGYRTVLAYTERLHRRGESHIAAWAPDGVGRPCAAIWKLGPGTDAPRSAVAVAGQADCRQRLAAELEELEEPLEPLGRLGQATRHLAGVWH